MALFGRKKKAAQAETSGEEKQGQLAVLKDAFKLTRKEKPSALLYMAIIFIAVLVIGVFV